jgi:hypothetical protein
VGQVGLHDTQRLVDQGDVEPDRFIVDAELEICAVLRRETVTDPTKHTEVDPVETAQMAGLVPLLPLAVLNRHTVRIEQQQAKAGTSGGEVTRWAIERTSRPSRRGRGHDGRASPEHPVVARHQSGRARRERHAPSDTRTSYLSASAYGSVPIAQLQWMQDVVNA